MYHGLTLPPFLPLTLTLTLTVTIGAQLRFTGVAPQSPSCITHYSVPHVALCAHHENSGCRANRGTLMSLPMA